MRQPDINRVKRAREHLKAALTVLNSIKWTHGLPLAEYGWVMDAKNRIQGADWPLAELESMQEPEP